jgi:hypothetical protein
MAAVRAVEAEAGISGLLPGADFVDAFRLNIAGVGLSATDAAKKALDDPPAWIRHLLGLRNALVAPLGLKPGAGDDDPRERIGFFPVESASPSRVVLGFDDSHLDFRLVVDVAEAGALTEVTATTLIRRHNLFGRVYLAAILPFHRVIVPALLRRVADR